MWHPPPAFEEHGSIDGQGYVTMEGAKECNIMSKSKDRDSVQP